VRSRHVTHDFMAANEGTRPPPPFIALCYGALHFTLILFILFFCFFLNQVSELIVLIDK